MRIKELHLTNFRGFEQLDIVFPNRLAVFIGINGAGKSAVIDAMSLYLMQLVIGLTRGSLLGTFQDTIDKNIKNGQSASTLTFDLEYKDLTDLNLLMTIKKDTDFPSSINYTTSLETFFDIIYANKTAKFINAALNLPVFIHYGSNRANEGESQIQLQSRIPLPQFKIYQNAFFHSINNFSDFINWFKEEEDREKDLIIAEKNFDAKNTNLETIRRTITTFLQYLNQDTTFSDLKINRHTNTFNDFKANGTYVLTIKKRGETFDLSQLSDGEKTILMLVCDIARRLTIANPILENPLAGEGIVLIDEIDLHLHPQWQREVVPALLATFSNLQFIVTTHSPQVLSKVKRESVFVLEDGKLVKNIPQTYGRNASAILFEIFGVTDRPTDVQDKINRCSDLLDEERYDEAKALLKELTDLLGEQDEAVIGARTQLLFDNQTI
ncbi:MAG: AAA family ATPase [Saprospiraceae bacterium]|nr:AAA family ATPase [Saprospiraceae bacterium]